MQTHHPLELSQNLATPQAAVEWIMEELQITTIIDSEEEIKVLEKVSRL
jgi:hypothetical protein